MSGSAGKGARVVAVSVAVVPSWTRWNLQADNRASSASGLPSWSEAKRRRAATTHLRTTETDQSSFFFLLLTVTTDCKVRGWPIESIGQVMISW